MAADVPLNGTTLPNGHATSTAQLKQPTFNAEQLQDLIHNALMIRKDFLSNFFDPRRSVEDECGFPRLGDSINVDFLRQYYERDAVANRVVEVLPKESWQVQPMVYETEDAQDVTPFEEAWDNLGRTIVTGSSWFQDEKGSPVWEYLLRADILSGIGHFGVILLGIDDGKNLMDPVDGVVVVNEDGSGDGEGYITDAEVDNLKNPKPRTVRDPVTKEERTVAPPPLNNMEQLCLNEMVRRREVVVNRQREREQAAVRNRVDAGFRVDTTDVTGQAVDSSGKQVFGTDSQYPNTMGLGMPGTSPLGTDQQYMGVQFGASEAFKDGKAGKEGRKLLFLRVFDESLVQIVRYEWNIRNPRFGQPVMYRITLNDPREQHTGIGLPLATIFVHWSRVVHVADNLKTSEIFGVPRLRPVLNNVLGLHRVYAADSEAFWKNCLTKLILETHPQMGGDVNINIPDLRNQLENFNNGLQPWLALMGMAAKTVPPVMTDPTPHVTIGIEAICIQLAIPVRVFKGSERGELASSQDDASWNDRLRQRQMYYITPRIIVRFIDRLIQLGVLPEPKQGGKPGITKNADGSTTVTTDSGYSVEWPDLDSATDQEKATMLLTRTQAYAAYTAGGLNQVIPERDYMTKWDDVTEEEADAILEAAEQAQEDQLAEDQKLAEEHGMVPTPPEGFQHPEPPPPEPGNVTLKPGETMHKPDGGPPIAKGNPVPPKLPAQGAPRAKGGPIRSKAPTKPGG